MRGPTRRKSKRSEKVEIVNSCYQWQILKPSGKRKAKKKTVFCQSTKRDRGERYFERYYRNGSASWLREIKMNRRAFVPINRMRAGYTSLKASLSRFTTVSMAECECGGRLQTEEHIFWDCKRYEEQQETMRDIPSENSKKEYPKSVTELFRLKEKIFL
jgi:hypothetical protein